MNILMLTSIYPSPDEAKGVSVCHYWTKEWSAMGHNVKVGYLQTVFPSIYYHAVKILGLVAPQKFGSGEILHTKPTYKTSDYYMDMVKVMRIPVFKYIPHGKCSAASLSKAMEHITEENEREGFIPDIIVGHFHNPQLSLIAALKERYSEATTGMVMHYGGDAIKKTYPKEYPELMSRIDVWGFRSKVIKESFIKDFGMPARHFMCYSGVPESYVTQRNSRCFDRRLTRFIYVGNLIARKYPAALVSAISALYPQQDFTITFVGTGHEQKRIEAEADKYGARDKVRLTGQVARDGIVDYLDEAECFIMISRAEAFGLVYLEAMARGCIVIGAKDEGIDGIITDGYNGFLCEAGNSHELSRIIRSINDLSASERKRISDNAIATASSLTDRKVAAAYLEALCQDKGTNKMKHEN